MIGFFGFFNLKFVIISTELLQSLTFLTGEFISEKHDSLPIKNAYLKFYLSY